MSYGNSIDYTALEKLDVLLRVVLNHALSGKSFDEFIALTKPLVDTLGAELFGDVDAHERDRCFYWLLFDLWNVVPIPENDFKPNVLTLPEDNSFCICASGKRFKNCCKPYRNEVEPIPDTIFWPFFTGHVGKKVIFEWAKKHHIPLEGAVSMAEEMADSEHYGDAIKVLTPYLCEDTSELNHEFSGLIDMFCDYCDVYYRSDRRKMQALNGLKEHSDPVIRAEAWQRLASIASDNGDSKEAFDALASAMRADPNNPSNAFLELILLMNEGDIERVKSRASFWYHKIRRLSNPPEDALNILKKAETDPVNALKNIMGRSVEHQHNALPHEIIQTFWDNYLSAHPESPAYSFHEVTGVVGGGQVVGLRREAELVIPEDIQTLERDWMDVTSFPNALENGALTGSIPWIDFIEVNPDAFKSLSICVSLMDFLGSYPFEDEDEKVVELATQIGEHAKQYVEKIPLKDNVQLPWGIYENRSYLRIIMHLSQIAFYQGDSEKGVAYAEHYLKINPNDNHAMRAILMNYYVENDMYEKGLAIAENFETDHLPDTLYGAALLMFKHGDLPKANKFLSRALDEFPKVAKFLSQKKVRKPKISDFGIQLGGDDQAWIYRDAMRDVWLAIPGSLEWLTGQIGKK